MDSGRLEAVPPGAVHLDTVRALHQTVVSLRTALEISKNELKELKEKYQQHSNCIEYADVIEKLTLENHILRRKIIDSGPEDTNEPRVKLQVTYSPRSQNVDDYSASEIIIKTATSDINDTIKTIDPDPECKEDIDSENLQSEENLETPELHSNSVQSDEENFPGKEPVSQIASYDKQEVKDNQSSFQTKLELLSKFDVRIKVRTLKEGTVLSSTTSESGSTVDDKKDRNTEKESVDTNASFHFKEHREHFEDTELIQASRVNTVSESVKMAVPEGDAKKTDKFDVQVRITSEENLVVKEHVERSRRKDTLNLDVDDLSLRLVVQSN